MHYFYKISVICFVTEFKRLKSSLLSACNEYVSNRIRTALQAIASAREAANDDAKSSAGDKYETTREMMQQDINRNQQLLATAHQMQQTLAQMNDMRPTQTVRPGSLVETTNGCFFIAISIGEVTVEKNKYFIISSESPLGRNFLGKEAKDYIIFNGKNYRIKSVH